MKTELPTEAGNYYWRYCVNEDWLAVTVYLNGIELVYSSGYGEQPIPIRFIEHGQWLRIPDAEELAELRRKADMWDAIKDKPVTTHEQADTLTWPDFADGCRTPNPEAEAILNEVQWDCVDDPVITAYRAAIKTEDVPEWATSVAWDRTGIWAWLVPEPHILDMAGRVWANRSAGAEYRRISESQPPRDIDWTQTLRRVSDVWPELRKGGA